MIVAYKTVGIPLNKLKSLKWESDLIKLSATQNISKLCEFQDMTKAYLFASTFDGYEDHCSNVENNIFIYRYEDFEILLVKK